VDDGNWKRIKKSQSRHTNEHVEIETGTRRTRKLEKKNKGQNTYGKIRTDGKFATYYRAKGLGWTKICCKIQMVLRSMEPKQIAWE
jgi:hypothetical protein